MKKDKLREVPIKNYYIVLIVSVLVIIITLYVRSFYLSYQASKINNSVFYDKSINQMNTDDFDFALEEINEAILYVSFFDYPKVYNMEKKLYNEFEKRHIIDKVIYWNVSDVKDNKEYIKILKNKYPVTADKINTAPLIIYIKDGEAMDAIDSSHGLIDANQLKELLTKYGIE